MKIINISAVIVTLLLSCNYSYCQYIPVEQQVIFQSRIDNPVKVEVLNQDGKYHFYATNRSYFPYSVNIHFEELKNLTPEFFNRDFKVLPGRIRLFSLSVKEKDAGHSYRYNFTYRIGVQGKKVNISYPYLLPVGVGRTFDLVHYPDKENTYFRDFFGLNQGDTIFAMRRGYIAAVPSMYHDTDRISNNRSLEIIHKDETIMIYENIDQEQVLVKPGITVNPGEPIGIINEKLILKVDLYVIEKDWNLRRLNINYCINENRTEPFSHYLKEVMAVYPEEVVTKEMTKGEIRRLGKQ